MGYFRSTVLILISDELIDFAHRGGRIRVICSPFLSEADLNGIAEGYSTRTEIISRSLENDVEEIIANAKFSARTEALATLIAKNILDIKVAILPKAQGIYHEKLGIFKDESGNVVSFKGSANETWNAWHSYGNFESIEVFCSWREASEAMRCARHADYYGELWAGKIPFVDIYDFPEAAKAKLCKVAKNDLSELENISITESFQKNKRKAFPHQLLAIENWEKAGCLGVLKHATGSGKTFTAMLAIKKHLDSGGAVIVVVPSRLLLRQWTSEVQDEVPNVILLKCGDGNTSWKKSRRLYDLTVNEDSSPKRVVVTTLQTASSNEFIRRLAPEGNLLIIADEVHQTGSSEFSNLYHINAKKRLGLSATPERYGDPDGTSKMFNYFGGIVEPIFTLQDAVNSDRLVKYEYFPHEIHLTADEAESWKTISERISKEVAQSSSDDQGQKIISDRVKMLLIQRSRIAKKASGKISLAQNIIKQFYTPGEKWLVYCEDKEQLEEVVKVLRTLSPEVNEYHTAMKGDMDATLAWFGQHGGILVSIKCLDEGVDIPDISHALILASSQNPRQFIQRRGRVLRKFPGKYKAVIHDAIVCPLDLEKDADQLALVKSELCRAIEFADNAINHSSSARLRKIAIELGLDIYQDALLGIEDDIV